jgi:hypothetical protein
MNEERVGHILVSEHRTYESVLNAIRRPISTSVTIYYDSDKGKWILGKVMTEDDRAAWEAPELA